MSINKLNTRLEAINDKCEKAIKLKLGKFHTDLHSNNSEFYIPSPQVIEALWFDLQNLPPLAFDHALILKEFRMQLMEKK